MASSRLRLPLSFLVSAPCLGGVLLAQGLPPVPAPPENRVTPEKAVLGKILFWDEQLSEDNTVACGTCHIPGAGGSDPRSFEPASLHPGPDGNFGGPDDIRGSIGVVRCAPAGPLLDDGTFFPGRQVTPRKAQNVPGSQWAPSILWDGRAEGPFVDPDTGLVSISSGGGLEIQALLPLVSDVEMACEMRAPPDVAAKVATSKPLRLASSLPADVAAAIAVAPTYPDLFASAFGDPAVTAARIAFALASYERTLVPDQTPWDLFVAGNPSALSPFQLAGLALFLAPPPAGAGCFACHTPPLFTDNGFHNLGVRPFFEDPGRQIATGLFADRGEFKTPSLRNVGLRAPYFHNGSRTDLAAVVGFYNVGGVFLVNQDPLIEPLGLNPIERAQIVDFVQNALTDPRVALELPPFDRPTLHSESVPSNPSLYGVGSPGTGGVVPAMIAFAPPNLGNPSFVLGIGNGRGGAPALLAFSASPAPPGTTILGIPIAVSLVPPPTTVLLSLAGGVGAPGAGFASLVTAIPDDPSLTGGALFAQAFVLDPQAGGGWAATPGASLSLFAP